MLLKYYVVSMQLLLIGSGRTGFKMHSNTACLQKFCLRKIYVLTLCTVISRKCVNGECVCVCKRDKAKVWYKIYITHLLYLSMHHAGVGRDWSQGCHHTVLGTQPLSQVAVGVVEVFHVFHQPDPE